MIILTHSEPEAHLLHQTSSWRAQRSLLPCGSLHWYSAPGHRWPDRWTNLLSCTAAAILICTRAAINEQEHKPNQNKTMPTNQHSNYIFILLLLFNQSENPFEIILLGKSLVNLYTDLKSKRASFFKVMLLKLRHAYFCHTFIRTILSFRFLWHLSRD